MDEHFLGARFRLAAQPGRLDDEVHMSSQSARPRIRPFDPRSIPGELAGLRDLGPRSAAMLTAAGVRTRDELARLGAIGACARVQATGKRVSLNLAYAIEGALTDCDWRALPH